MAAAPSLVTVGTAPPVTAGTLDSPVTVGTVSPPLPSAVASLLNSTLVSAALLSFGCQRYTPKTKNDFHKQYDYIVVGSGYAGSVVASRLSELPCVTVLLLEAGKTPTPNTEIPGIARFIQGTDFDWQFKTARQNYSAFSLDNQQVQWPSGKAVGGSSVINPMIYIRGNRKDCDNWDVPDWSYDDVKSYFIRAEDNKNARNRGNGWHGKGGPMTVSCPRYYTELKGPVIKGAKYLGYKFVDSNGPKQTGFYDFQATMRGGQRCSAAKAYLVPAENRTNLDIVQSARVLKVIIKNNIAIGVKVDYMGQTRYVLAREEVILSAGAVITPQLLMLSGIGPKKHLKKMKIPVVADLPVGQNLHDHPISHIFYEVTNRTVQPLLVKIETGAPQYAATRSGPLASAQFLFLTAFLKDNETAPVIDFPNHLIYLGDVTVEFLQTNGMKQDVYAKTFAPYSGRAMLYCTSQVLQPASRGTITLQSTDPYVYPIIDPNYLRDPQDAKALVEGLKNCNRLCTSPPVRNFGVEPMKTVLAGCEQYPRDTNEYYHCYGRSMTFTMGNPVGTAKMGDPKDPTTVVDPQLRVKNIQGLRVVDGSIIPKIPSGNADAAVVMIAEKASDIIKSTISCDC